nr:immunoglobulin heavy chain junction region [Mus musculus]
CANIYYDYDGGYYYAMDYW